MQSLRPRDELEADYKLKIDELNSVLEELGRTRLIANERIQKISESISKIGTVSKKQYNNFIESINYTKEEVEQMSFSSRKSSEILQTGIKSLSSGALAGFGAMGLIGNIGVASTGAAISGLSGVAATNATLAWLGGGTLAMRASVRVSASRSRSKAIIFTPDPKRLMIS